MARIIVVDDDELFCDVACEVLSDAGHSVSVALDGESALTAIAECEPDLVVLDYNLPGISGLAVLRRVRQDIGAAALPILMLTREDGRLMKARADYDGADDYLVKPCVPSILVEHVEALLVGRGITSAALWTAGSKSPAPPPPAAS